MTSLRRAIGLWLAVLVLLAGCSDPAPVGGTDSGSTADGGGTDGGGGGNDSGATEDSGAADTDSGTTEDSGAPDTDSGTPDTDAGISCAGVECLGYAAALAAEPRGASSIDNCVIQLHQTDCCGARAAYGINHAARTALCAAEATCVASYPDPICSDDEITTDTGDTTTDMADIRVRLTAAGVCETFVCATGPCRSEPGIAGGCGP